MNLETKRTLTLTKAEKKALTDFYWNFYDDVLVDDMFDILRALAENIPEYAPCEIKITD